MSVDMIEAELVGNGSASEKFIYQETLLFKKVYGETGSFYHLYTNDGIEIALIVSGNGTLRMLDNSIPCKEGDIFAFRPNSPHGYFSAEQGETLTVRRILFDPLYWFDGEVADLEAARFCYGVFSDNDLMAYAVLTEATRNEIDGYYNAIALETEKYRSEWKEAVRAQLSMLLITVGRYVGRAIKNVPTELPKNWSIISSVMRFVDEHLEDSTLTLEKVAESLYVSKSHISRTFKQCTGETFSDYLGRVRIERACELLRETDLTVQDIVSRCGKKDVSTFYHSFYESKGVTPNQYRMQKRGSSTNSQMSMSVLGEIAEKLQRGKLKLLRELILQAIDDGVAAEEILDKGLLRGMKLVGERFKNNEIYVPEVLVAARAMNMGAQMLKPYLAASGVKAKGKVCIGTVQGDLHDIGKNLVKMMLEGKGFEVIDLGTDVSAETFVKTAIEEECQVICCSALLTTTMGVMADVVKEAEKAGIRDKVKIMIGGAPISEEFCCEIGADAYTSDAASAADKAVALCEDMMNVKWGEQ